MVAPLKFPFTAELSRYGFSVEERINSGTYGAVYKLRHKHSTDGSSFYALKLIEPTSFGEQRMREKGETADDLVVKEFIPPSSDDDNLLGGTILYLGAGLSGVLMPYYPTFANDIFGSRLEGVAARHAINKPSATASLTFIADVIRGASKYYQKKGRAHSDIKLENIAIDSSRLTIQKKQMHALRGTYRLGDFGSSYYADWSVSGRPGMRIGDPTNRAPELFTDDPAVHPTRNSDSWSIGSLLFFLSTGQELWEHKINYNQSVAKVGADLEAFYHRPAQQLKADLEERLSEVPAYANKLTRSLLVIDPQKRTIANAYLEEEVRTLARRYNPATNVVDTLKSYGKVMVGSFAATAVMMSMLLYLPELTIDEHQPIYVVVGKTVAPQNAQQESISYERNLLTSNGLDNALDISQKWLMKDEAQATVFAPNDPTYRTIWNSLQFGLRASFLPSCKVWDEVRKEDPNPVRDSLARRLKIAVNHQRKINSSSAQSAQVDFEDTIVETLWGQDALDAAKKIGGENYQTYSHAMQNGKRIIPQSTDAIVGRSVDYLNTYFASRTPELAQKMVAGAIRR